MGTVTIGIFNGHDDPIEVLEFSHFSGSPPCIIFGHILPNGQVVVDSHNQFSPYIRAHKPQEVVSFGFVGDPFELRITKCYLFVIQSTWREYTLVGVIGVFKLTLPTSLQPCSMNPQQLAFKTSFSAPFFLFLAPSTGVSILCARKK